MDVATIPLFVLYFFTLAVTSGFAAAPASVRFLTLNQKKQQIVVFHQLGFFNAGTSSIAELSPYLSVTEIKLLASMGGVVKALDDASRKSTALIGRPFRFAGNEGAVGILTSDVVVELADGFDTTEAQRELKSLGALSVRRLNSRASVSLVSFGDVDEALEAVDSLQKSGRYLYAHPDFMLPKNYRSSRAPQEEPLFSRSWHLENNGHLGGAAGSDVRFLQAFAAVPKHQPSPVIAVLDAGFDIDHQELATIWSVNTAEVPNNGLDDDQNGYADDYIGWSFRSGAGDPRELSYAKHGTSVVGLAASPVDGLGNIGTCPGCRVVPIALSFKVSEDAEAFYYGQRRGASVFSNSWGYGIGTPTTDVVTVAIQRVSREGRNGKGAVVVFAVNNLERDDCTGAEPDIASHPDVFAVGASAADDKRIVPSAFGHCLKVLAPSRDRIRYLPGLVSTDMSGNLGYNKGDDSRETEDWNYTQRFGGTSGSAPIVAGIFGLMIWSSPDLSNEDLQRIAVDTADKVWPDEAAYDLGTGFSLKYGYGRINAHVAVTESIWSSTQFDARHGDM